MSDTITVLVSRPDQGKGIFSDGPVEPAIISTDKLKASLSGLVAKLSAITADLAVRSSGLTLKEMEVGVEVTAEGGVNLIGTAKAGATASLKLTFVRSE